MKFFASLTAVLIAFSQPAYSQLGGPMGPGATPGMGMGMAMGSMERFNVAPEIGEELPDLTIFDDQGNPVNVRELAKENYKVLVLGCLT